MNNNERTYELELRLDSGPTVRRDLADKIVLLDEGFLKFNGINGAIYAYRVDRIVGYNIKEKEGEEINGE